MDTPQIQVGPKYVCFHSNNPVSLRLWQPMGTIHSPLDDYGQHIGYLVGCNCGAVHHRVAVLGPDGLITPLDFAGTETPFHERVKENVRRVLAAVAFLSQFKNEPDVVRATPEYQAALQAARHLTDSPNPGFRLQTLIADLHSLMNS